MNSSNQTSQALNANLWKLNAVRLLFWMHFLSAVLVPFYRDWGGLSYSLILLVNGWFMVWNFLLEIPTGTVADLWGRRTSLIAGCVVASVAALIYISTPSLWVFLGAEILFAAAFTLMSGADEAMLYDTLKALDRTDEAQHRYGKLATFQQIGIVVGALLGAPIAAWLGLRAPLGLQVVPMLMAGALALTLQEPKLEGSTTEESENSQAKPRRFHDVLTVGLKKFFESPPLKRLTLDMVSVGALSFVLIWFYQPTLERVGVPLIAFGVVHTAMSLGQIGVLANVSRWSRWLGSQRNLLRLGPLALLCLYPVLALADSPWLVIPAIVLIAALGLSRAPLFSSHLNQFIDSEERATVLSTVNMMRTLATALLYLIVGPLADRDLSWMFLLLAAFAALTLIFSPLRSGDLHD